MLAQGYGVLKTSQEIGNMSKNTVRAIRRREGETIDLLRGSLGSRSYDVAEDMLEAAQVLLEEVLADPKRRKKLSVADVQRLLVSVGIAVEKAQLLTGGATNRVMVETAEPQHNDYNAYIQSLKTAAPMGLAGKSLDQKESAQVLEIHAAAPETALAPAAEAVQAPGLGSSDTQSEGQHTQPTATQ